MSRVSQLPIEKWDPELRKRSGSAEASSLERDGMGVLAHAPHMAAAMSAFMIKAMAGRQLPRRMIELVRLRVAFHNQCRSCMSMRYQSALDDGLTEGMVCSLEKPYDAPDLTERDKAALAYADQFSVNHLSIDDDTFATLRQHFSEPEIVELAMFVSFFVGFGRFGAVMNTVDDLQEDFKDLSRKVAPWEVREAIVVRG